LFEVEVCFACCLAAVSFGEALGEEQEQMVFESRIGKNLYK